MKEYLHIILQNENAYAFKNILAITFTNKAANEMKERVLHTLNAFASKDVLKGGDKTMLDILKVELLKGEEFIRERSREIITSVLHNYGDFNITTIDKFILRIVRAFAHDLKLPINFEIELDDKALVSKAVDQLLMKVGEIPELTSALIEYSRHQAAEGESWGIEKNLKEIAPELLKEQGFQHIQKIKSFELSHFIELNKSYSKKTKEFERTMISFAKKGMKLMENKGLTGDEFSNGSKSFKSFFKKITQYDFENENKNVVKIISEDKWYKKDIDTISKQKIDEIKEDLKSIYSSIQQYKENYLAEYEMDCLVSKNLFAVALLNEIEKNIEELRNEQNFVHISEFNKRILEIVLTQPIPFVYERIGEKFKNYLIDEFQDTSVLQWQNLLPLIDNSLASANKNLVVGDTKQAIYRFRGGDVEQFVQLGDHNFTSSNPFVQERLSALNRNFEEKILNENFRSSQNIIAFNNSYFEKIKQILPPNLMTFYKDYFQNNSFAKAGGFVQVKKFEEEGQELSDQLLIQIKNSISDCIQRGYQFTDIAILVRQNEWGSTIADDLLENNIPVVSSESLLLGKNPSIKLLISILQFCFQSSNKTAAVEVVRGMHLHGKLSLDLHDDLTKYSNHPEKLIACLKEKNIDIHQLSHISLYELVQKWTNLLNMPLNSNYMIQFFDCINQFCTQNGPDLARFLIWWEENEKKLSVQVDTHENAVTISTVHKSKGLEYPIVIIPFLNQQIYRNNEKIWIDKNDEELPSAYVHLSKSLLLTSHADVFNEERNKTLLDYINMLYVAFTRAKTEMYIFGAFGEKKEPTYVGDLLAHCFEENSTLFQIGEKTRCTERTEEQRNLYSSEILAPSNWRQKIKISRQAPLIWNEMSAREYGTLIHTLLAEISCEEDTASVIEKSVAAGLLDSSLANNIQDKINQLIHQEEIKHLFKKGLKTRTEKEIITKEGNILRPDKIIELNDIIYLIDFKTGEERPQHISQIKEYAAHVRDIENKDICCLLLYIDKNKVVSL